MAPRIQQHQDRFSRASPVADGRARRGRWRPSPPARPDGRWGRSHAGARGGRAGDDLAGDPGVAGGPWARATEGCTLLSHPRPLKATVFDFLTACSTTIAIGAPFLPVGEVSPKGDGGSSDSWSSVPHSVRADPLLTLSSPLAGPPRGRRGRYAGPGCTGRLFQRAVGQAAWAVDPGDDAGIARPRIMAITHEAHLDVGGGEVEADSQSRPQRLPHTPGGSPFFRCAGAAARRLPRRPTYSASISGSIAEPRRSGMVVGPCPGPGGGACLP